MQRLYQPFYVIFFRLWLTRALQTQNSWKLQKHYSLKWPLVFIWPHCAPLPPSSTHTLTLIHKHPVWYKWKSTNHLHPLCRVLHPIGPFGLSWPTGCPWCRRKQLLHDHDQQTWYHHDELLHLVLLPVQSLIAEKVKIVKILNILVISRHDLQCIFGQERYLDKN